MPKQLIKSRRWLETCNYAPASSAKAIRNKKPNGCLHSSKSSQKKRRREQNWDGEKKNEVRKQQKQSWVGKKWHSVDNVLLYWHTTDAQIPALRGRLHKSCMPPSSFPGRKQAAYNRSSHSALVASQNLTPSISSQQHMLSALQVSSVLTHSPRLLLDLLSVGM